LFLLADSCVIVLGLEDDAVFPKDFLAVLQGNSFDWNDFPGNGRSVGLGGD